MNEKDNDFDLEEDEEETEKSAEICELEEEFKKLVAKHSQKIDEQLIIAAEAISKAEKISEQYGIPFYAGVSPLSQSYFPATFARNFSDLDADFVTDITGAYTDYYGEGEGWEHSAVC